MSNQNNPTYITNTDSTKFSIIALIVLICLIAGGYYYYKHYMKNNNANTNAPVNIDGKNINNGSLPSGTPTGVPSGEPTGVRPNLGKVTEVSSSSISIKDQQSNETKTYSISSATKITKDNATITASDIAVDDTVMILTESGDSTVATEITLNPTMAGGEQGGTPPTDGAGQNGNRPPQGQGNPSAKPSAKSTN